MKPPSRNRVKPARYILNKKHERRKKKLICSAWKIHEQRALLAGLRRQRRDLGGNGEINFAALKSKIPKRSVQEVESMVVALKNHMVKVVLHNHSRQRNEERRARVPIELWTKLARDMAGSLEEPIAFAFSQMLTICSTEPRSLRHSDPPHEGTPIGPPNGRTIPLRPSALSGSLVHLPRPPRGPAGAQAGQLPTPSSSAPSVADDAPVTPPVSDLAARAPPTSSEIPDSTSSAATPTNRGATGPSDASASLTASVPSALATVVVTSGRHVSAPSTPGTDALNVSMSTCTTPPVSSPLGGATASQAAPSVLAKHCPSPASTCTTTTSVSSTSSLFTPTTSSASLSATSLPIITSSAPTAIPLSTPTIISSSTPTIITTSTPTIVTTSTPTTTSSSATICSSTSIISSSTPTIICSSTSIISSTTTTTTSSSSQDARSRPCSRSAQEGFPRAMGIRCIVDFEKIYSYLSSAHRADQEDTLTSMESAVLLDLLLSLPEELPLLDCVGLEKHMIQVYNRLTFPANPKLVPSNMDAGASISTATDSAGSQRVGTEPDAQPHSQSALTDNASSQSGSSSQVTLDWKKAGICPLNPFIVPMQLLARRHSTQ